MQINWFNYLRLIFQTRKSESLSVLSFRVQITQAWSFQQCCCGSSCFPFGHRQQNFMYVRTYFLAGGINIVFENETKTELPKFKPPSLRKMCLWQDWSEEDGKKLFTALLWLFKIHSCLRMRNRKIARSFGLGTNWMESIRRKQDSRSIKLFW